jgi:peptidoglycan/LPS O-acetylase OafA/YrhL
LGPILTTFSLKGYFSDPRFLSYFVNIIGGMRFWLPGLFVDNPYDVVNISLWTVGNEMGCYVLVAALMLAGVTRRRRLMLSGLIIAAIILTGTAYWDGRTSADDLLGKPMLFMCFMWGDILYRWRDLVPLSGTLAVLAVLFYSTIAWFLLPLVPGIGSLMVAYLTVYLGHQSLPRPGFLARGDYSYGIYLYASPVQQTIIQLLPSARYFFVDVLLATPIVLLLAAFSWHVIERPALSLRKRFAPSRALLAGSLLNRS